MHSDVISFVTVYQWVDAAVDVDNSVGTREQYMHPGVCTDGAVADQIGDERGRVAAKNRD